MDYQTYQNETICLGDNLHFLRQLEANSVDLVYLDPPYNSSRTYQASPNTDLKGAVLFSDTWSIKNLKKDTLDFLEEYCPKVFELANLSKILHSGNMKAYLSMLGIRLHEIYRVLKESGTVYLHCDDTSVHYLKLLMDAIFGSKFFKNEITLRRHKAGKNTSRNLARNSDYILRYTKSSQFKWHPEIISTDISPEQIAKRYKYTEPETGRRYSSEPLSNNYTGQGYTYELFGKTGPWLWKPEKTEKALEKGIIIEPAPGCEPRWKKYLDEGIPQKQLDTIWLDIPTKDPKRTLGFRTRKHPLLLDRLIRLSTDEGDLVLDPFCGSGTTCLAASRCERNWIGMDINPDTVELAKNRLENEGALLVSPINIITIESSEIY